ncbi:unnamed protein product [Brassica rapa]|uniref:Protein kinase domain-containing protein n=1 Tax=Brassica campestris TaxID=3711 RepID=A0A8D9H9L1_BRACM|nr:unnamed protein product [Brassica rapa]
MGETCQPNTLFLVFVFFTLAVATVSTGSINCQLGLLRYPFGFSDGYPIRFNCSKNGFAEIGEFAVDEVRSEQISVEIPALCTREISKLKELFQDNFAPSNFQNMILLHSCNESSISCSISPRFLQRTVNFDRCTSAVRCLDGAVEKTADVMSTGDVNRSGCKYWLSSVSASGMNNSELSSERLILDWWLKDGCSNATCSENAVRTEVTLPGGQFGHRCTCGDGYYGDAFTVNGGCRSGIGITSMLVGLVVAGGLLFFILWRKRKLDGSRQQNLDALIPLKRYSYAQLKKITNSFVEVVGKGGFGTVYKGTLSDGRSVAVKLLKDSKANGEDFMNEVASMSKTSHVNIVNLLGFCAERSKRAVLYEFLENGSLDRFISGKTSITADWTKLYNIALGIARDDNFCPKVSDFGLAKLCENKENFSSVLDARGTIGYIAPEFLSRMYGRVSNKSDVYSYGMLVLEMIGARNKERADQNSSSNTSSMYFPEWIYKDLENGISGKLVENGISIEEEDIAKKMTLVGLWCIQSSPSNRPPMNKVVEMMEGNVEALEVPPRPVLQIPSLPLQESSSLSMDITVYAEEQ